MNFMCVHTCRQTKFRRYTHTQKVCFPFCIDVLSLLYRCVYISGKYFSECIHTHEVHEFTSKCAFPVLCNMTRSHESYLKGVLYFLYKCVLFTIYMCAPINFPQVHSHIYVYTATKTHARIQGGKNSFKRKLTGYSDSATPCHALQHACNTLKYTATHTFNLKATGCTDSPTHTTRCDTLQQTLQQHTASTHCNNTPADAGWHAARIPPSQRARQTPRRRQSAQEVESWAAPTAHADCSADKMSQRNTIRDGNIIWLSIHNREHNTIHNREHNIDFNTIRDGNIIWLSIHNREHNTIHNREHTMDFNTIRDGNIIWLSIDLKGTSCWEAHKAEADWAGKMCEGNTIRGEVGGWGRDPKKCTGRDWGMGSSTI